MNIGKALPTSIQGRLAVIGLAMIVVALLLVNAFLPRRDPFLPWASMLVGLGAMGVLSKWDSASMGFTLRAAPSWRHWMIISGLMAGTVLAFAAVAWFAATRGHDAFALCSVRFPPFTAARFIHIVLIAPFLEEVVYRLVLVSALAAALGKWPAVALGGCIFAAAHWLYGVQGPDNLIAGFLLSWAYLKSETLMVPLALHAGGNLGALVFQHYIGPVGC